MNCFEESKEIYRGLIRFKLNNKKKGIDVLWKSKQQVEII